MIEHPVDDHLDLCTCGIGGCKAGGIQKIALSIDRFINKPAAEIVKPAPQGVGVDLLEAKQITHGAHADWFKILCHEISFTPVSIIASCWRATGRTNWSI